MTPVRKNSSTCAIDGASPRTVSCGSSPSWGGRFIFGILGKLKKYSTMAEPSVKGPGAESTPHTLRLSGARFFAFTVRAMTCAPSGDT